MQLTRSFKKGEIASGAIDNAKLENWARKDDLSRGCGHVVGVLAFYSEDPSSSPAEACIFSVNFVFERRKIYKRGQGWPIF